jgi:uroporphyrinogen-III synthase
MFVLVTRPEPDATTLVGRLQQRGHQAMAAPLLHVSYEALDPDALDGVTGLIATSRHGLRALVGTEALERARRLTVYAVGRATALEAQRMGFARVVKGPGTAEALGPLIASLIDPAEEVLLHLAGDRLAFDLARELGHLGVNVSVERVYQAHTADAFSPPVCAAIADGTVEAVLLMSPQTAATWARLVRAHDLETPVREIFHICMSDAVARRLSPLGEVATEIADAPTVEELLALVDQTAAKSDV